MKSVISQIQKEAVGSPIKFVGVTVAGNFQPVSRARLVDSWIIVNVGGDVEIEETVVVDVGKGGARAPRPAGDSRFFRDVREGAVSVVQVEDVRTVVGDVEIDVAIVVNVSHGKAAAVVVIPDAGSLGDIFKSAISEVSVKDVGLFSRQVGMIGIAMPLDQVKVQEGKIKPSSAPDHGLVEVLRADRAVDVHEVNASLLRDVDKNFISVA